MKCHFSHDSWKRDVTSSICHFLGHIFIWKSLSLGKWSYFRLAHTRRTHTRSLWLPSCGKRGFSGDVINLCLQNRNIRGCECCHVIRETPDHKGDHTHTHWNVRTHTHTFRFLLPCITWLFVLGFPVLLFDPLFLRPDLALVDTPSNDPGSQGQRSRIRAGPPIVTIQLGFLRQKTEFVDKILLFPIYGQQSCTWMNSGHCVCVNSNIKVSPFLGSLLTSPWKPKHHKSLQPLNPVSFIKCLPKRPNLLRLTNFWGQSGAVTDRMVLLCGVLVLKWYLKVTLMLNVLLITFFCLYMASKKMSDIYHLISALMIS